MDAILAFHSVDGSGSVLSYRSDELERLLDTLAASGAAVVPLAELLGETANAHRVALTFDDGLATVHRNALPVLRERGLPATLYVVSGWMGRTNQWPTQSRGIPELDLMGFPELKEWSAAGLEVGCHTANHVPLRALDAAAWDTELQGSRRHLEAELELPVRHFAYPYGILSEEAIRRARGLFETAVTTELAYVPRRRDPHLLPRIDAYYLRGAWSGRPLFAAPTRAYLRARAWLRAVRRRARAPWSHA